VKEVEIRPATPEDLSSIKAVFKSHSPDDDWRFAKRYYRSYFSRPADHFGAAVFVGVSGGRVAAVIGYLRSWGRAQGIFWLGWFYVHKEEGGNSFGKALLDHVVAEVKKRGARKLYTDTSSWKFYDRAHHRYRALGFQREATLRDYYDAGEHQVIYAMDLG
jgi:ribosomal protein S18 acetylase RimI-like enzyme